VKIEAEHGVDLAIVPASAFHANMDFRGNPCSRAGFVSGTVECDVSVGRQQLVVRYPIGATGTNRVHIILADNLMEAARHDIEKVASAPAADSPDPQKRTPEPRFRVIIGKLDADGLPLTSARACLEGTSLCYEPEGAFGLAPKVHNLRTQDGRSLTMFTAEASGGGSGSSNIIALLESRGNSLVNLLPRMTVSNQSEYAFWDVPSVSRMPVLVTADYEWAEGESHFSRHHYRVTAFTFDEQSGRYAQRAAYVTRLKYAGLDDTDSVNVLKPEKSTIMLKLVSR